MRTAAEIKVGLITLVAIALLFVFTIYVRGFRAAASTYSVCVIFENARGLQRGDPVRLAGVKIGEVQSVEINEQLKAEVTLTVYRSPRYILYDNYKFRIATAGLIQERFVDVAPEPYDPYRSQLEDGACVDGVTTPELADFVEAGLDLVQSLNKTSRLLQRVLTDQEVIAGVEDALRSFSSVADAAVEVAASTKALADESRPRIVDSVTQFNAAVADLRAVSDELQTRITQGPALDDLQATVASARETTANTARITATLADALSDPENKRKAEETLAAVHDLALSLKKVGEDLEVVSGELRKAAPTVPHVAAQAEEVVEDFSAVRERLKPPQIDAAFDVLYSDKADRTFSSGRLDLKTSEDRFLRLGIDDIGEEGKVNVQLGEPQRLAVVRYGLVRSRLGVGLDFELPRESTLSLDLFDPNELRGDILADVPFLLGRGNWSLLAGVRDIGEDNYFVAGLRLRK